MEAWLTSLADRPNLPPMRPIFPGGQAAARDVVGRDEDITRLWNRLLAGSCLLNEPRRIGKSSLLLRATAGVKPPNWELIHTSVQGISSTAEFAAHALHAIQTQRALSDRLRTMVRSFLVEGEVSVGAAGTSIALRGAFQRTPLLTLEIALGSVHDNLADDGRYLALAWDEFPDMVVSVIANEGAESASAMLGTLRRFRELHPERIRWLLTGSVGLHHALRRISSSGEQFVTDLTAVPLGPLSPLWARWLAGSLLMGAGCGFDESALDALAGQTDGIPYLLHLAAGWARDHGPAVVTAADVPDLFIAAIGDLDASHQSTHLLSRLGDYYGDDTQTAEWLLDRIAMAPATRDELASAVVADGQRINQGLLRELLGLLERDHYLVTDGAGRRAWRFDALRRIWVQRRA